MRTKYGSLTAVAVLALGAAACGDDGDDVSELLSDAEDQLGDAGDQLGDDLDELGEQFDEEMAELGDEMADAMGAGGGGTLIFDGEEIPIDSAVCNFGDEDTFEVGTVSDNGFRVLISRGNPLNDIGMSILDEEFVQWFPRNVQGDEAVRDGETFTAGPHTFFNNSNDLEVEAQATVECP